jgi:hypothetical protein
LIGSNKLQFTERRFPVQLSWLESHQENMTQSASIGQLDHSGEFHGYVLNLS